MKKLIFILTTLIFTACNSGNPNVTELQGNENPYTFVTEFTYKGHGYISFEREYRAGVVHNPECKKCLEAYD